VENEANYKREQIIELEVDLSKMIIYISDLIDLHIKLRSHENAPLIQDKFTQLIINRIKRFMQAAVDINERIYTQNNDQ
jgi:hypothetical protein